jgi:hypothetical protein
MTEGDILESPALGVDETDGRCSSSDVQESFWSGYGRLAGELTCRVLRICNASLNATTNEVERFIRT